ncbi:MAG: glycosyltransferase [Flavobacteriales bacterium]|nr:glycosyltransferase [Flavobacteriales bacterium]
MILYLTYNDQPSGVYWSQVTDVVSHLNTLSDERVRLVALVSMRGYSRSFRSIRAHAPGAVVLPMVPRARNWRINRYWVLLVCLLMRPSGVICRGIFATALALHARDRELVRKVCFDARAAYGAEWEEFRVVDDDRLIAECAALEGEVLHQADVRLAVSHALVDHWHDRFGYKGYRHLVIPCTLSRSLEPDDRMSEAHIRGTCGWGQGDTVLVYSGTVVGWQSLELLRDTVEPWLAGAPDRRMLFLSEDHPCIADLRQRHPGQVARMWLEHQQVRAALLECDLGLLLRDPCVTNRVASPTKFAEYLSAGLPVLISEEVGDLTKLVEKEDLGQVLRRDEALRVDKPDEAMRVRMRTVARERFTKQAHKASYRTIMHHLLPGQSEWVSGDGADVLLVSIIVPSFNKRTYIGAMVASVLAQTDPRWELLVIDDASTDGSPEVIADAAQGDPRVRVQVLEHNSGANVCRNLGIGSARGRYVIFLDADDLLAPDCVARRLAVMNGSGLDLAVFTMEVFHEKPGDHGQRWVPDSSEPLADFFRHKLPWQTMQPIWDRDFLRRIGGFDVAFSRHQDVELHTRTLLQKDVRYRLFPGEPDCHYRIAEERKVIDPYPLLRRFSESAVLYRNKFLAAAQQRGMGGLLLGILHRTYLQILLNAKMGRIDEATVDELGAVLLGSDASDIGPFKRWLFRFTRWYNSLPFRVPGVNWAVSRLLTA